MISVLSKIYFTKYDMLETTINKLFQHINKSFVIVFGAPAVRFGTLIQELQLTALSDSPPSALSRAALQYYVNSLL